MRRHRGALPCLSFFKTGLKNLTGSIALHLHGWRRSAGWGEGLLCFTHPWGGCKGAGFLELGTVWAHLLVLMRYLLPSSAATWLLIFCQVNLPESLHEWQLLPHLPVWITLGKINKPAANEEEGWSPLCCTPEVKPPAGLTGLCWGDCEAGSRPWGAGPLPPLVRRLWARWGGGHLVVAKAGGSGASVTCGSR